MAEPVGVPAGDAGELEFAIEEPENGSWYSFDQKIKVLRRTSESMHDRGEWVTRPRLVEEAKPYLPKMTLKTLESFMCSLYKHHREHYDSLRISETRRGEWEEIPLPDGHPVPRFTDVPQRRNQPTSAAPKKKGEPFTVLEGFERELAAIRARREKEAEVAPRKRPLDVEPVTSLTKIYTRDC